MAISLFDESIGKHRNIFASLKLSYYYIQFRISNFYTLSLRRYKYQKKPRLMKTYTNCCYRYVSVVFFLSFLKLKKEFKVRDEDRNHYHALRQPRDALVLPDCYHGLGC